MSTRAAFPHARAEQKLVSLAAQAGTLKIAELLDADPDRIEVFSTAAADWHLDYSRHCLTAETREALLDLAEEAGLDAAREALFDGRPLNHTENRAVGHTLLRASTAADSLGEELAAVRACRERMSAWVDRVSSGDHRGHAGDRISDVVNLGIGGSDLGPRMVVQALRPHHSGELRVHFCANVDPGELRATLDGLDPATTLFIVCSKTLRTEETLYNAACARQWLLDSGASEDAVAAHFLAVSTNLEAAREFGIPEENILPLWDWVGGRYSLWSAIGWSIAFAVGNRGFDALLAGAEAMDHHFRNAPLAQNMPVWLSLLEIWSVNFLGARSHAVVPYHHDLRRLPAFLQQLSMESNGKSVNHAGEPIAYATAPVLWGDEGSNGQHSFHQLLHQGTLLCPVDFVLPLTSDEAGGGGASAAAEEGRARLVANCLSQGRALLVGRDEQTSRESLLARGYSPEQAELLAPHLVIPGNRPSSTLSCESLTPHALGALLALYEHKTYCSGHIWQINSFDQWGVELGKELSAGIYAALGGGQLDPCDPSTAALIERYRHGR